MNRCEMSVELHRRVRQKYPDLKIDMYQVRFIVRELFNLIIEILISGQEAAFLGFGTFYCEETKPAPRGDFHGNIVIDEPRTKLRFHVSPVLKDRIAKEIPAKREKE